MLDRIVLGGADIPYPPQMRVRTLMDIGASRWQNWDDSFATHLVDLFGVNTEARFSEFSRGQKTLAGNVIGLAASAEITLLDEPYLGLDVQNRDALYRALLDEIGGDPERTFIISTPPCGGRCLPAGFGDPARPGACHDGAGRRYADRRCRGGAWHHDGGGRIARAGPRASPPGGPRCRGAPGGAGRERAEERPENCR